MSREQLNRFIPNYLLRILTQDPMLHARQNRRWSRDTQARNQRPLLRLPPTQGQAFFEKLRSEQGLHSQTGATQAVMSVANANYQKVQFQKKSAPEKKKKRIPFLLSHRHQTRNIVSLLAYARNNARKMDTDTSVPEKE
ncbi:hypothetical protein V3481_015018 [Fusarium oxysporum f. sp. vasinfectum]